MRTIVACDQLGTDLGYHRGSPYEFEETAASEQRTIRVSSPVFSDAQWFELVPTIPVAPPANEVTPAEEDRNK